MFIKVELGFAPPRSYTYIWGGGPIERGDFVIVPPNSYNPSPSIGRVLRTMERSDFTGTATVLRHKADVTPEHSEVKAGERWTVQDDVL